jgi:hypothetical protein
MPTYAPSWEQTSPSPPPLNMGGGGTLTHRESEGAGAHVLPAESGQQLKIFFRVLACIFIKLSTSNYCTHKINKYSQHYPPSPPQGGDGFDHCIIYGMRLYY